MFSIGCLLSVFSALTKKNNLSFMIGPPMRKPVCLSLKLGKPVAVLIEESNVPFEDNTFLV